MKICEAGCTCGRHSPRPERGRRISEAKKGRALTHGLTHHPLYATWHNMMARCYNPNHRQFDQWGGRGITVAPAWHDVATYIAWVESTLGPKAPGMSLDRIDNDGNYEPGNLRWATKSEQSLNRRPFAKGR
jgi:hypothetical protein